METITFEDAVRCISSNLEKDRALMQNCGIIVDVLGLLFQKEKREVQEAFSLALSEEEVVDYAKKTIMSFLGNQMTADDIYKVEIIPGGDKKLFIRGNANFDPDESYSCLDAESVISRKIRFFTGYDVDISL